MQTDTKQREKEKKQKIKQLEAEIREMKRDHKATFSGKPRIKKPTAKQFLCAVSGLLLIIAASLAVYINPPEFSRYALFRVGNLRFTRSVFFLPLAVSALFLIFSEKKKAVLISLAVSSAVAVVGLAVSITSEMLWFYIIMYMLIFVGAGLLLGAYIRYKNGNKEIIAKKEKKK